MSTAFLKNYRQSARKVRLVVDLVRGKRVNDAVTILKFTPKRAAKVVQKVVESAKANAVNNQNLKEEDLVIKEIMVDEGVTLKRWRPRARGSAATIRKRTSHIKVVLDSKNGEVKIPKKEISVQNIESDENKKTVKKETALTKPKRKPVSKKIDKKDNIKIK